MSSGLILNPKDRDYTRSTLPILHPGITQFLSKPAKWFGRKASDSRSVSATSEPRSSTSSVRRPKISRPTDPRPILASFQSEPHALDASKSADDLRSFADPSHSAVDMSFQNRIQEYRNRSNSSATLHPASSSNNTLPQSPMIHAFPTFATGVPLSSSPPDDDIVALESNISISISSPTTEAFPEDPQTPTGRMHSFAPRLPTKLSASKLGFSPSSPKRKGSGDSMKPVDSDKASGTSTSRGVFPFSLAGTSSKHSAPTPGSQGPLENAVPSPLLLAPPTPHDALDADDSMDSRRISQIMYNTGFINRLTDAGPMIQAYQRPYSTAANFTLSKGWKSFKAELKGSKLYFYKPPSDRSAAVKELFPTEIVPANLEDEVVAELELSEEVGRSGRGREEGAAGRKKRAYWGRSTHPELVLGEGGIEKGNLEALVHEAVFATTFLVAVASNEPGSDAAEQTEDGRRPGWKEFSSAVILCLPSLVERSKFENEFTRLCANLVDGANDSTRETERARVVWMAHEYLRYHDAPIDEPGWEEFRGHTIPNFSHSPAPTNGGLPKSVSTQALYTTSPNPGPSSGTRSTSSPNLSTFSPRPQVQDDVKMASLMEALGTANLSLLGSPGKTFNHRQQRPQLPLSELVERPSRVWSILAQDGFSREVLSLLDPHMIALSLQIFHRRTFQSLPVNLTTDYVLGNDTPSPSSPGGSSDAIRGDLLQPVRFFGSDDHPHWLTRLLLMQILSSDSSSTSGTHQERSAQTSRTHSRCEVISIWARVGELCRVAGDECSWMAISAALCSRPVARLTKAWRRVDRQSLIAVESWIYAESDGRVATVREPMVTAWGGETKELIRRELDQARDEIDSNWIVQPLLVARDLFEGLRTKFALYIAKLVSFWEDFSQGKSGQNALALKFQRIDQFMKGHFEPFFWSQAIATPQTHCHPLVPLLFVEPMPAVSLIDRGQVWRGRLESGPTKLSVEDLQQIRSLDTSLRPLGSNEPSASKEGTAIPVYDGELLLVARPDKDRSSTSRPASRAPSRPPSSAIEGPGSDKTVTRTPSVRGLERKSSMQRRSSLPAISPRPSHPVMTEVSTERPIRVVVQAGTLDRLVNVLIHGLQGVSVAVADDNGETSLRDRNTRDLIVDHSEFARVWWNVFRSFVTPVVFFEILGAMKEWITGGGGAQDCLDDSPLYETDRAVPDFTPFDDDSELLQAFDGLEATRKDTLSTFISHTLRPPTLAIAALRSSVPGSHLRSFGNQAPDIDVITAEDLVDNLNAMGTVALGNVSEEDLFITADLLEVQSADRTGWFSARETSPMDDVDIQTMSSHLMEVEPSSMISELSQDCVYRILPPSVRSCIRAYNILRRWLISKLVAPKLGIRNRQARMDLSSTVPELNERPSVRSFVEAVITAAVISPESRMHQRPWQNVANIRGVLCDSLSTLLSRPTIPRKAYGDPLVVDISWLLERMVEIISIPNAVVVSQEDSQCIINLDKRRSVCLLRNILSDTHFPRHLCDLILNTPTLVSGRSRSMEDVDRKDFERLNNIEKEMSVLHFDHRGIKDEAQREALQAQISRFRIGEEDCPAFQRLVMLQHEKNKRDKYLHDRLSKDKKLEQQRIERRDEYLNKLMRPISSAFTDNTHTLTGKRSPAELDFSPSGKPSLVISVVDAKVAQFINNERSQVSRQEMAKWIDTINKVSSIAAKRRLTYLGNSPKPQLSDHIHDPVGVPLASRDPAAVFGVELDFLLEREAAGNDVLSGALPSVISRCLLEVEARGLSEVGIYRIAGATSEVNALRDAFNRGEMPITESSDIHAVCDLIKSWFRVLPEPVFPASAYFAVIEAIKVEKLHDRLSNIRRVVHGLPQANFDLLKRVAEHLDKVTDFEEHNQMTAEALAIVFSPNLLRAPQNDFALILANMGHTHKLVKALITHFHVIFDDDFEAENDAEEDEMEAPIMEEEEEEDDDIRPSQTTLEEL
ncbi:hypothetical protein BU15DRAFT_90776 [Melanogaster broomeanus]|nr:hypothetical protein BU15DRAFT_90776 [Melanogaster broomeanus]